MQNDDIHLFDNVRLSLATSEIMTTDELLKKMLPDHTLIKRKGGKPDLIRPDGSIEPCSITHTKGFSAFCWGEIGQIGIDAERADRRVHVSLSARMRHPDDDTCLIERPIDAWIIKESVLKCIGTGLRVGMNSISVRHTSPEHFIAMWNDHVFHGILLTRRNIRLSIVHTTSIL